MYTPPVNKKDPFNLSESKIFHTSNSDLLYITYPGDSSFQLMDR